MKFIEVVPQYPLPIPVCRNEDYFTWPVKMMKEKGFDVEIISLKQSGQKQKELIDGITVKRFNNPISLFLYLLSKGKCLVYAQGKIFPAFISFFCKRSIYTPHGSYGQKLPKYLRNFFLKFVTKFLFSKFNKVIAITPYEASVYKRINFKKNYLHIYNGIDYGFFSRKRNATALLKKYKIEKKEKLIIFVGNIHGNVKNIDILYKAFKLVREKIKKVRLVIVGKETGEESDFLLVLKSDQGVVLTGFQGPEEITEALSSASVFVNTSKNEGHSLAVSEAASAGVPLCLSRIGTFTSTYKNNALYHNPFDYKKLSENIIFYLKNRKFALKCAQANKKLMKNECDLKLIREKFLHLFLNEYQR